MFVVVVVAGVFEVGVLVPEFLVVVVVVVVLVVVFEVVVVVVLLLLRWLLQLQPFVHAEKDIPPLVPLLVVIRRPTQYQEQHHTPRTFPVSFSYVLCGRVNPPNCGCITCLRGPE